MPGQSFNQRDMKRYAVIGQVGLEMVAPIVVGLVLDNQFDWGPWGVVVGAVVGLGVGLFHLVRLSNRPDKDEDGKPPPGDKPA